MVNGKEKPTKTTNTFDAKSIAVSKSKSPGHSNYFNQPQILQIQHYQQRCSSVGSTGSSTCDTLSSYSGSALSPTISTGYKNNYSSKKFSTSSPTNTGAALAATLSGVSKEKTIEVDPNLTPLSLYEISSRFSLNGLSPSSGVLLPATAATTSNLPLLPLLHPLTTPVYFSSNETHNSLDVNAAAAIAATNLAESFSLLQHQTANHFHDILYAAHLMGRGYYQPAGPLISPHILQPVPTGAPLPLTNVSLLQASTATNVGGVSTKKQIPIPLGSDPEPLHPAPPSTTSAADSTDSDVLITGGDLTPFRYPNSTASGATNSHRSTSSPQQQMHPQTHGGAPYPRSMHAPQMHYLTAYPPNYFSPYPGETMCYSPSAAAYQPYFSTKMYQGTPPHPPPGAYRRYSYYQPGPPPPAELYEHPTQPPANSANGSQESSPLQPPGSAPPPSSSQGPSGSQLVPTSPVPHTQHLEHYPGPPGYYSGYSPGGGAGQCYTRNIQTPYMEYPPQCPCPMQQSCPKNVNTGPHIGSNNGNSIISHDSNSTAMNKNSNNIISSNNSLVNDSQNISIVSNKKTNCTKVSNMLMDAENKNMKNLVDISRGPVQKSKIQLEKEKVEVHKFTNFLNPQQKQQQFALRTKVKSELKTEESDCKSQYEEHIVQPPTPPESYGTNEEKSLLIEDEVIDTTMERMELPSLAAISRASNLTSTIPVQSTEIISTTTTTPVLVPTAIEFYDLTTTQSQSEIRVGLPASATNKPLVGRKARIGKTMAREMVYAAAATTTKQQQQHFQIPERQTNIEKTPKQTNSLEQNINVTELASSFSLGYLPPSENLPLLSSIKSEIKDEHIKLEDEVLETILKEQHQSRQQIVSLQSDELKIKMEPLNIIKSDSSVIQNQPEALFGQTQKSFLNEQTNLNVVENNRVSTPITLNEGQIHPHNDLNCSEKTSEVNCEIDLSSIDDDILDLCHENNNSKRIKILDLQNLGEQSKKSSSNSYKNLIKQAEPKAYLSLSRRRIEKRRRFNKLQHKVLTTHGLVGSRRRNILFSCGQNKRLRLRRKKIMAFEQKCEEVRRKKRITEKQKQYKNEHTELANIIKTEPMEIPDLIEIIELDNDRSSDEASQMTNGFTKTSTKTNKQYQEELKLSNHVTNLKAPAMQLPLLHDVNDSVARGYYSEPETICGVFSRKFSCETELNSSQHQKLIKANYQTPQAYNSRPKINTNSFEKRSKSETKKPIKGAKNKNFQIFPVLTHSSLSTEEISKKSTASHTTTSQPNDSAVTSIKLLNSVPLQISSSSETKLKQRVSKTKLQNHSKAANSSFTTKPNMCANSKAKQNKKPQICNTDVVLSSSNKQFDEQQILIDCTNVNKNATNKLREANNNEVIEKQNTPVDKLSETFTDKLSHTKSTTNATTTGILHDQTESATSSSKEFHSTNLSAINNDSTHSDIVQEFLQPSLPPRILCHSHHYHGKRTRSRAKFGPRKRQKQKHSTVSYELDERLPPAPRSDVIPKWNNGWTWEGKCFQGAVFLNSDDPLVLRTCYPAMRHLEGDIIQTRDCVLLKANEDNELPYVAKVAHLWENPEDGEMMVSLLWYYRPEHTEQGRQLSDSSDEVYASRHRDHNSVACIEDKCYVLTFSEYCRYRRRLRATEDDIEDVSIVPKSAKSFYSTQKVPDNTNTELVMFCRRAYEFRTRRLLKMPNKQDYYVVNT